MVMNDWIVTAAADRRRGEVNLVRFKPCAMATCRAIVKMQASGVRTVAMLGMRNRRRNTSCTRSGMSIPRRLK
jgi:hypothetical protein